MVALRFLLLLVEGIYIEQKLQFCNAIIYTIKDR